MAEETLKPGSLWQLRWDVISARVLLWFAGAGRIGEATPGAHLYLADRYSWLAERYRRLGNRKKATRLEVKAVWHFRAASHDDPPAAVAVAMPIPEAPVQTNAVAHEPDSSEPDDVA